jgi:hypothetical protein
MSARRPVRDRARLDLARMHRDAVGSEHQAASEVGGRRVLGRILRVAAATVLLAVLWAALLLMVWLGWRWGGAP